MHLKRDILLLANNFRKICLENYSLGPPKFLSAPGLASQAALKGTEVKEELLTDIDTLLNTEKCIRGGTCYAVY